MPTKLTTKAIEKSTYIVNAAFEDENENPVTPAAVNWTLTDEYGGTIATGTIVPSTAVDIVLSGDDLALPLTNKPTRLLLVEGTYVSNLGELPYKDVARFEIDPIRAVS